MHRSDSAAGGDRSGSGKSAARRAAARHHRACSVPRPGSAICSTESLTPTNWKSWRRISFRTPSFSALPSTSRSRRRSCHFSRPMRRSRSSRCASRRRLNCCVSARSGGWRSIWQRCRRSATYFQNEKRDPTDAELEMLAQTWSEHCVHKTFKALIDYTDARHWRNADNRRAAAYLYPRGDREDRQALGALGVRR